MNEALILDYIDKKGNNNKEILTFIHQTFVNHFPNIEIGLKWGMPHYGHNGLMCGVGSSKHNVNLFFHKGKLMKDTYGFFAGQEDNKEMRCIKITNGNIIEETVLIEYIKEAIAINEKGIKVNKPKTVKTLEIPVELQYELDNNPKAQEQFNNFPFYKKKEYTEWILSAKQEETIQKRLKQAIDKITQGIGKEDRYRK